MRRAARPLAALVVSAFAALVVTSCASAPAAPRVEPKLRPPAIAKAGVLRVAVDEHYPPFAAVDGTAVVGIDADVAQALASSLGLAVEFVDVPATSVADALRAKRADVALAGLPITQAALADVTIATSYLADGPAVFSKDATLPAGGLASARVAVQKDSASYWLLRQRLGEKPLVVVPTLRDAFAAAADGRADLAAGDAVVAAYIARDTPGFAFAGQLGDAVPLALLTAKDSQLQRPLRDAMDELASTGALDAVRGKWLGEGSDLQLAGSGETSRNLLPQR